MVRLSCRPCRRANGRVAPTGPGRRRSTGPDIFRPAAWPEAVAANDAHLSVDQEHPGGGYSVAQSPRGWGCPEVAAHRLFQFFAGSFGRVRRQRPVRPGRRPAPSAQAETAFGKWRTVYRSGSLPGDWPGTRGNAAEPVGELE